MFVPAHADRDSLLLTFSNAVDTNRAVFAARRKPLPWGAMLLVLAVAGVIAAAAFVAL
jgi:hypothetical protein